MQKTLHFGRKRVILSGKLLGSKIFRILMPIKGLCNKKIKEVKEAKVKEIKEQRNIMIKRNLHNIPYIPTSHGAGMKRVLIANEETESKITQIAITELTHGTTIDEHVHRIWMNISTLLKKSRTPLVRTAVTNTQMRQP